LNTTLEKLKALQKQEKPPTAKPNPAQGGAPKAGGLPNANITDKLSATQAGAIGDKVRECWTKDAGALGVEKMQVYLTVTTDQQGVARQAVVADQDKARVDADPRLRSFAERAVRAVLSARCASLPLPKDQLGAVHELTFVFRP
jgi:hypothetical protein